jgi:hypothetical protein
MIFRCGNKGPKLTRCGCGDDCPEVESLTPEEFDLVSKAFIERLGNSMAHAGCNDLFETEFPRTVCERFGTDFAVLAAWEQRLDSIGGLDD